MIPGAMPQQFMPAPMQLMPQMPPPQVVAAAPAVAAAPQVMETSTTIEAAPATMETVAAPAPQPMPFTMPAVQAMPAPAFSYAAPAPVMAAPAPVMAAPAPVTYAAPPTVSTIQGTTTYMAPAQSPSYLPAPIQQVSSYVPAPPQFIETMATAPQVLAQPQVSSYIPAPAMVETVSAAPQVIQAPTMVETVAQPVMAAPQVFAAPPMMAAPQVASYIPPAQQQFVETIQPQVMAAPASYIPAPIVETAAASGQSVIVEQVGEWQVCEDAQGIFYHHVPTQQSFDNAPAEFLALFPAGYTPPPLGAFAAAGYMAAPVAAPVTQIAYASSPGVVETFMPTVQQVPSYTPAVMAAPVMQAQPFMQSAVAAMPTVATVPGAMGQPVMARVL